MDKYITRERRMDTEYPKGNQMVAFSATSAGNNITMYPTQNAGLRVSSNIPHYIPAPMNSPIVTYGTNINYTQFHNEFQLPAQIVSGIDPGYLAAYNDNNAMYVAGIPGRHKPTEMSSYPMNTFNDYQNRLTENEKVNVYSRPLTNRMPLPEIAKKGSYEHTNVQKTSQKNDTGNANTKSKEQNVTLNATSVIIKSRSDKLKELYRSGPRVFSGPVEKVLKWHKSLQDIGVLVLYEVVAKCVNIRDGESRSKNLVVRDENGPAMQIVYYEIDYLMHELTPPCTVRVIGRMISGTNRLHAFNVRLATGDDVATLPRRAAVGAHHVAKLSKEYGTTNEKS